MRFNILISTLFAIVIERVNSSFIPYSRCSQNPVYCQSLPLNCMQEDRICDTVLIASAASDGQSNFEFELFGRTGITRHWFGIALSDDRQMANDSVTEIYSVYVTNDNSSEDLRQTWSLERGSEVLSDNQVNGIRAEGKPLNEDGIVSAKWIRHAITEVVYDLTRYELDMGSSKQRIFVGNSGERVGGDIGDGGDGDNEQSHLDSLSSESRVAFLSSNKDALKELYEKCNQSLVDYCLGLPQNCISSQSCDLLLTINSNGLTKETVSFQLIGKLEQNTNTGWIAVGLSLDDAMGSDSVVECLALKNGTNEVTNSWNEGYHNIPVGDIDGVDAGPVVNSDGLLNCQWTRTVKTDIMDHIIDFNSTEYYLLLAKGVVDDEGKKHRHTAKTTSSSAINLMQSHGTNPPTSSTGATPTSGLEQAYQRCKNSERLCFGFKNGVSNCIDSNNCQMLFSSVSTSQSEGTVEIELFWVRDSGSKDNWAAVALSDDQTMGGDSVTECIAATNGKTEIRSGINPNGHSPTQTVNNTSVQPLDKSVVDNLVHCKWSLDAITNVSLNGDHYYFDVLNNSCYLLLAFGPLKSDGNLGQHSRNSRIWSDKVNLQSVGIVKSGSNFYVQVHASLMIIAWLGCVSIAILLARHYKNSWPDTTFCGVKIWFALHRFLMVLGVTLILIAFVLILVNKKGWVGVSPHPVVGLISIILSFMQPIGAVFRPHPDSSIRWLFNWLHWSGGYLGHGLAFIAILLSTNFTSLIPENFFWILISFIIFYIFSHISLHHLRARKEQNGNIQDFKTSSDGPIDTLVIALIVLVISALVSALVVLVFV